MVHPSMSYSDYGDAIIAAIASPFSAAILTGGAAVIFRQHVSGVSFPEIRACLSQLYPDKVDEICSDIDDVASFVEAHAQLDDASGLMKGRSYNITTVIQFAREHRLFTNATVEVLTKCNLRCVHCFHPDYANGGPSIETLSSIFSDLRRAGALFLCLTGGEIFIRNDAPAIIGAASDAGFLVEIKSNGTMLGKAAIRELARHRISDIQISVYGIEDGQNEFTNGNYCFTTVAEAIRGLQNAGLPCSVSFQITPMNIHEIDKAHDILSRLTNNFFFSFYVTPNLSGSRRNVKTRLNYPQLRDIVLPRLRAWGMAPDKPTPYRSKDCGYVCWAGHEQVFIASDGKIFPCPDLRMQIGDISQQPITDIINGRFDALKEVMPTSLPTCLKCTYYDYCDSCIGVALAENGTFHQPSQHKCDLTHLQFEADDVTTACVEQGLSQEIERG